MPLRNIFNHGPFRSSASHEYREQPMSSQYSQHSYPPYQQPQQQFQSQQQLQYQQLLQYKPPTVPRSSLCGLCHRPVTPGVRCLCGKYNQ